MISATTAAGMLEMNLGMLKMTIGELTDAEMMMRPVPHANHAAWQLGHLAKFECMVAGLCNPAKAPQFPEKSASIYGKEGSASDDASKFMKKDELLALMDAAIKVQTEWCGKATEAQMNAATPENIQRFAQTLGQLVVMGPMHVAMHIGQFQVLRRKLGKPVLF